VALQPFVEHTFTAWCDEVVTALRPLLSDGDLLTFPLRS
jgi:hypothetical protein